jgi:hypothetical protein
MTLLQLLLTAGAVIGIIVVGLLAIIPSLLDIPQGHDHDEPDLPAPTPLRPNHRRRHRHHNHPNHLAA